MSLIISVHLDSGNEFILIMRLTTPASDLAPFCPTAPEHYAKISFDKNRILFLVSEFTYFSAGDSLCFSFTVLKVCHYFVILSTLYFW